MSRLLLLAALCAATAGAPQPSGEAATAKRIADLGLSRLRAYSMLRELTQGVGPRLSGSPAAARAVEWGRQTMERLGFERITLVPARVPHWVRNEPETCAITSPPAAAGSLACLALGDSVGTPAGGIEAPVYEVHSIKEFQDHPEKARGAIVFFNQPMDPTLISTMEAYGRAGPQRFVGPSLAAAAGAVAAVTRSLTLAADDVPHTGMLLYDEKAPKIPAAALSVLAANRLSIELGAHPGLRLRLVLSCRMLPDVDSFDVVGELTGTDPSLPAVVMGGHLDSWDVGQGAHDDGAGIVHSLEALSLLRDAGIRPRRTIRVVLFMNEENGERGAEAYAAWTRTHRERVLAGIESDSGGFLPFGFSGPQKDQAALRRYSRLLAPLGADRITVGGGGADVDPLGPQGAATIGLNVNDQLYFDYHHSIRDTLDKVNPRELELGAIAMATLAWQLADHGLDVR